MQGGQQMVGIDSSMPFTSSATETLPALCYIDVSICFVTQ